MQPPPETAELGRAVLGWEAAAVVLLLAALLPTLAAETFPDASKPHFKPYSGFRVSEVSLLRVVAHDQTVGVIELARGAETRLLSCELIEVSRPQDMKEALLSLQGLASPEYINFMEMNKIMAECRSLPPPPNLPITAQAPDREARGQGSLLSGIVPGTKWCGTGDIAENYHDLGVENDLDRCCRSHDLCPVKVKAFRSRYNLTNLSVYTKSHCDCDSMLYSCLKSVKSPKANILGQVYFNLLRVPCVEDTNCNTPSCKERKLFQSARQRF